MLYSAISRYKKNVNQSGLTLLEVLLSVMLMVGLSLGTISVVTILKSASMKIDHRQIAVRFMESKLSDYQSKDAAYIKGLTSSTSSVSLPAVDVPQLKNLISGPDQPAQMTTKLQRTEGDPGLIRFDFAVVWTDYLRRIHREFLTGYVYRE